MQRQGSALTAFTVPAAAAAPGTSTLLDNLPGIYQMHPTRMAWGTFFEQCAFTIGIEAEIDALFDPDAK